MLCWLIAVDILYQILNNCGIWGRESGWVRIGIARESAWVLTNASIHRSPDDAYNTAAKFLSPCDVTIARGFQVLSPGL